MHGRRSTHLNVHTRAAAKPFVNPKTRQHLAHCAMFDPIEWQLADSASQYGIAD